MVRQIIADLEAGDFCISEKASLQKSIEDYKKLIETNKTQITTLKAKVADYEGVIVEKQAQIELRDKTIDVLEKEKKGKFWNGFTYGAAGGSIATILLLLL